ncbi:YceI family protein [Sphingomonas sp. 2R-10]|uniref:YceI family protein n=1 Tax=Sphingomonas sp. 2R-10 TaxID=3045148 RepID=UPI000F7A0EED|nr:YceI family protein [Sphingomonas sp. 2R-10]MDJ0277788.1 YceI family protein [Sphingomonas sp. 2R-10]
MRTPLILAAALFAVAAPTVAQLPGAPDKARVTAGTYTVDTAHTQVHWRVNHMGFSMLDGLFGATGGTATIDPKNPAASKVAIDFDIARSLTVTSPQFAEHLKSKDFFDVANNPTAKFVSTRIQPMGDHWMMNGNLTIKGQTKPVQLTMRFVGAGENPMNKKKNVGFTATGSINRSEFGLGMAVPVVSDKVDLTINAAFVAA